VCQQREGTITGTGCKAREKITRKRWRKLYELKEYDSGEVKVLIRLPEGNLPSKIEGTFVNASS